MYVAVMRLMDFYSYLLSFLIKSKKDIEVRKWAAEGLSYLTMDAEVKVCVFTAVADLRLAPCSVLRNGDYPDQIILSFRPSKLHLNNRFN